MPFFPVTTSGIVIISGSNYFDSLTSDFPIVIGTVISSPFPSDVYANPVFQQGLAQDPYEPATLVLSGTVVAKLSPEFFFPPFVYSNSVFTAAGKVLQFDRDIRIKQTLVTTSGITLVDFGIDILTAGYIVPVYINSRLFPYQLRLFPITDSTTSSGVRVYPRLPQFSVIIP